jgi:hypothetical protein
MTAYTGTCYTEEEKARIQLQLDRVLANAHFSNSKRFPSFLRFIVQEELEGRGDQLKERTLGMEVFGRDASYDTTSDPIVRVTAAEIRKRIAQYYQETGHADELRISLPPGSYVPHFDWPHAETAAAPVTPAPAELFPHLAPAVPVSVAAPPPVHSERKSRTRFFGALAALLVLITAVMFYVRTRPSALDLFWAPLLSTAEPVIVCFPQSHLTGITLRDASDPTQQHQFSEGMNALIVDDLRPLVSLSGLLELHKQRYILIGEDTASLTDLRQGPTVFLGAFDNAWTLRVTRGLRFRFANDPDMKHFWIEDTQSPTHTRWSIDRTQQEATNNYRDYAIVARFQDPSTGKPAVIAAGIARGGTVAAGEFLTQTENMESLRSQAPKNWNGKNMEFVLSTEIIDGKSAPPKIEAVHFW